MTERELDRFLKGYYHGPDFHPSIKFPPAKVMIEDAMKLHPELTRDEAINHVYESVRSLGPIY